MLLVVAILLTVFVLSPPLGIAVMVLAALVEVGELLFWRRFLRRYRIQTGTEAMVGARAEVLEDCAPDGRVTVGGEIWNARSERPIVAGQAVRIVGVEGLTLSVEPVGEE